MAEGCLVDVLASAKPLPRCPRPVLGITEPSPRDLGHFAALLSNGRGNGIRFVGSLRKKIFDLWSIRAQHSWCLGLKACFPLPLVGFVVQNLGLWPGILSKRMSGSWFFWAGRLRARASNCRPSNLSFSRPSGSVLVRCSLVPVLRTL